MQNNNKAQVSSDDNLSDIVLIRKRANFQLDLRELLQHKDLFYLLIWKQIRVRYAQSILGFGWAVAQPLFSVLIITIVFGRLAKLDSDGAPYAIFGLAALIPWNFFANSVSEASLSLVAEAHSIRKIYFPRLLLPISTVLSKLVDIAVSLLVMGIVLAAYRHPVSTQVLLLPVLVALLVLTSSAISIWLSALAIQYRDVKHGLAFAIQLGMYASPVVYSTSIVPNQHIRLYALNPLVGIIEGFRSSILGSPIQWNLLATSIFVSISLLLTGLFFFKTREKIFADVA